MTFWAALVFTLLPSFGFAQSMGGGGGGDRPGYTPVNYVKSRDCAANEWRVNWEQNENGFSDHPQNTFYTCEAKPILPARYVYNPDVRCEEGGRPQPVTVPTTNGRSVMKWAICKDGRYVLVDP